MNTSKWFYVFAVVLLVLPPGCDRLNNICGHEGEAVALLTLLPGCNRPDNICEHEGEGENSTEGEGEPNPIEGEGEVVNEGEGEPNPIEGEGEVVNEGEGEPVDECDGGQGTRFAKTIGGINDDSAEAVVQTEDGGYALAGYLDSSGSEMYSCIIKTDAEGNQVWSYILSDIGAGNRMMAMDKTNDQGFIMAGYIFDSGRENDYLIKVNTQGNKVWYKTYNINSQDSHDAMFNDVIQTTDGGYVCTGYTTDPFDIFLLKIDADGNQVWLKIFGNEFNDWANSVCQTSDGGYVIAGSTNLTNSGSSDARLLKTDADGNELWSKTFGGIDGNVAEDVRETSDGGLIFVGNGDSYGKILPNSGYQKYMHPIMLVRTDSQGNQLWLKNFGLKSIELIENVRETPDGGFILAGGNEYWSWADSPDVCLIKTDGQGDLLWYKIFGKTTCGSVECSYLTIDNGYGLDLTADGGFIIAGNTRSYGAGGHDIYLIKTDACGNAPHEIKP